MFCFLLTKATLVIRIVLCWSTTHLPPLDPTMKKIKHYWTKTPKNIFFIIKKNCLNHWKSFCFSNFKNPAVYHSSVLKFSVMFNPHLTIVSRHLLRRYLIQRLTGRLEVALRNTLKSGPRLTELEGRVVFSMYWDSFQSVPTSTFAPQHL